MTRTRAILLTALMTVSVIGNTGCGAKSTELSLLPGHENTYTLPFLETEDTAEGTVLIQPGDVSCYEDDSDVKPKIQIWYDNADTSTNTCSDLADIGNESSASGMEIARQIISEFYGRLINTSYNFAGAETTDFYTLTGPATVDMDSPANNLATWSTVPRTTTDVTPMDQDFYVRSLIDRGAGATPVFDEEGNQIGVTEGENLNGKRYQILGEGVLHQLYKENGVISDESFAHDINVVFSDLADADLNNTSLGEMIAGRMTAAIAAGEDISFHCIGIRLPFYGLIAVPERLNSLQEMQIYRQSYSEGVPKRCYYFLITGPTEAAAAYTESLSHALAEKIVAEPGNSEGFAVKNMFNSMGTIEGGDGESSADDVLQIVPVKDDGRTGQQAARDRDREENADSADTDETDAAETTEEIINANELSDEFSQNIIVVDKREELFQTFQSQHVGDLSAHAEKVGLTWKKFINGVKITNKTTGYPMSVLLQLKNSDTQQIVGKQLYQAQITDDTGCTWIPIDLQDPNYGQAGDTLTNHMSNVYLKLERRQPQMANTYMLEVDIADKVSDDLEGLINQDFMENYASSDIDNVAYFVALNLHEMAASILSVDDTQVKQKCYVLIYLSDSLTKTRPAAARNNGAARDENSAE